jgi:acetyl-CoA C-acetyltransferase
MLNVFILSAVRTPIGKFGGALSSLTAADLGVAAAQAALQRAGVLPEQVQETIIGNARQAGGGPNVARQISIRSGVPQEVPAYTVNMACASGMKSIALGCREIADGNLDCVLVGGTESMSRLPYYLDGARWGYRLGNAELVDGMYRDGFFCPMAKMVMGETADTLAERYSISREEQDQFAFCSQKRAAAAIAANRFDTELIPVTTETKQGRHVVNSDEHPFPGSSLEKLSKLPPVFTSKGTVTAGNSSGINDGAAAVVLASEAFVRQHGLKPLVRIIRAASGAVDPRVVGLGIVPAVRKLDQQGLRLADFDLVEFNEAFAAFVLACDRELHFDFDKLNVNGGAISLGHPIGCSGARIVVTLVHEMLKRDGKKGLATLCASGGLGMALAVERT